jgi:hypothetical protein
LRQRIITVDGVKDSKIWYSNVLTNQLVKWREFIFISWMEIFQFASGKGIFAISKIEILNSNGFN